MPATTAAAGPPPPSPARLGPGFGGAWMNADATELVVGLTAASQIKPVEAEGARPKLVGRSLAQLDGLKAKLDRNAGSAARSVPGWYVDPLATPWSS